jgi:DNA-binding CsgD family transcriptional regulator/tetratricopeptide (TPR) repeat protein
MPNTRTTKQPTPRTRPRHQAADRALRGRAGALDELLDSAESPGSAILIVGVPGSGRSTLLEELRANAPVRAVWVAPSLWDSQRSLAGLSLALNAVGERRLSELVERITLADSAGHGALSAAAEVLTLLRSEKRDDTLLVIDDADRFDPSSQLALSYLAGRLANTGLRLVLVVTPESALSTFAGIRRVWVSRLDHAESLEMARTIAPGADALTLALICHWCAGLPGMIAWNIAHLTGDQLRGHAPLVLPLSPGADALGLSAWEPETLALLQRFSAAPLSSIAAVPDIRNGSRDRFEQLASQGVLEISGPYVSIRDGVLRSSLYWSMTGAQREALHYLAADQEREHSRGLSLWHADHGTAAQPSRVALLREARELYEQGLTEPATEFVERALLLNPAPGDLLKELLALCSQLTALSEFALARRYLSVCRRAATKPKQLAECLRLEVTIATLADEDIDVGLVDSYARRYQDDSPSESAELLAFAAVSLATGGDATGARTHIDRAYNLQSAAQVSTSSVQYWARRYVDGIDGHGVAPSTTATAEPDPHKLPTPVQLVSGRALMIEERHDAARDTFRCLALQAPRQSRATDWTAQVLALSVENEIRAGDLPEASRTIEALVELAPNRNLGTLLLLAWREAVMRDSEEAEALLAEAHEAANRSRRPLLLTHLHALEGSIALMRGDLEQARAWLSQAYEPALELCPGFFRMEANFVEVLARRGEWDAARRVAIRFAERAANQPFPWAETVLARCAAITAPDDELLTRFNSAIAVAKKNGEKLELGRARLSFSMALDRIGQGQRASDQRLAAEFAFGSVSANGWISAVRRSTRTVELPLQSSLLSTLTESELAVLRLMHKGVRNKEIAAALFVSLRTVEVRITQIYRKLEARSRSHLLTLLPTELDQIDSL